MSSKTPTVSIYGDLAIYHKVTKTLTTKTKAKKLEAFKAWLKSGMHGTLEDLKSLLKLKGENTKMRASLSAEEQFVEVYILPAWWVTNPPSDFKGRINEGELSACESACPHRHDNYKREGVSSCYVNAVYQIIPAAAQAAKDYESGATWDMSPSYKLRLTAWGDVSRLSPLGLDHIESLLFWSESHLAYTAGWRAPHMQRFKGFFQASCSTVADALLAQASGWQPFLSVDQGEVKRAKNFGLIQCPTDKTLPRPKALGCSVCTVGCDGSRPIVIANH